MKALIIKAERQAPVYTEVPAPVPAPEQAFIQLKSAALNHRDLYITQGLYANIQTPCILGSDGAGESNGQRVVLYPALEWGENPAAQGRHFRVLGMPDPGTFAEQICLPKSNLYPMPPHLNWAEAAALPLAFLTAWRVLMTRCGLQKGQKVFITGIGGGVAVAAMQLALAAGAEVYVSSGSDEKIARAKAMGASDGVNYKRSDWARTLKSKSGGFDIIIDSAAGDGFAELPGLCAPGASIGLYGGTTGKVNGLSMQPVFWKQISILGSTMGTPTDFADMLQFVEKQQITPVVDAIYPLENGAEAFEKMEKGAQFGKLVLSM